MSTGNNSYSVVLIDDNPLTVRTLREMILRLGKREGMVFYIEDAHNIDSAQHIIENFYHSHNLNYIFLNLQTISSSDNSMVAKELLAQSIQQKYPHCKLVLSTPYSSPYHIYALINSLLLDGLLIKKDLNYDRSLSILQSIILYPPYFSPSVAQILEKGNKNLLTLDKWDRRMLYELSLGATIPHLKTIIPMSRSTIIRHKNQMKLQLGLSTKDNDRNLLSAARKKGLI